MNGAKAMQRMLVETNDWMIGGSRDPVANRAYGFREAAVAQAAASAYIEAFDMMGGEDRPALHAAFFECFKGEIVELLER